MKKIMIFIFVSVIFIGCDSSSIDNSNVKLSDSSSSVTSDQIPNVPESASLLSK
jgi:hypothetical protein